MFGKSKASEHSFHVTILCTHRQQHPPTPPSSIGFTSIPEPCMLQAALGLSPMLFTKGAHGLWKWHQMPMPPCPLPSTWCPVVPPPRPMTSLTLLGAATALKVQAEGGTEALVSLWRLTCRENHVEEKQACPALPSYAWHCPAMCDALPCRAAIGCLGTAGCDRLPG